MREKKLTALPDGWHSAEPTEQQREFMGMYLPGSEALVLSGPFLRQVQERCNDSVSAHQPTGSQRFEDLTRQLLAVQTRREEARGELT